MTDSPRHHAEHRKRLKDKFSNAGPDALHDYEILELLLMYSIPRKDVKPLAKDLLKRFGSFRAVLDADQRELEAVAGMGRHSAIGLRLAKEIGSIYLREKAKEKPQITCTRELVDYCQNAVGGLKDENFCVIYLDAQNKMIEMETIQKGIVNQAVVYPRMVLEKALQKKSSAIILVHNHPSGHVRPSDADIRLTKTIQDTAKALDILVHDHLIIGENRFFSFREEGILR